MRVKRDTDGIDIWRCSLCEDHFKIDLEEYMKIKSEGLKKTLTTYRVSKGLFKTWWWLILAIVLVIYAFYVNNSDFN